MTEYNPIYEIQEYLRALSGNGYQIPRIIPDGIYGPETRSAVADFQSLVGLPSTGRVDYSTWEALKVAYDTVMASVSRSAPIFPFEENLASGKVVAGDAMSLIYIIQIILRTIGVAYQGLQNQEITGEYDANTISNIRDFQKVNGLPITGEVDKMTWNRLAQAYNKYLNQG